MQSARPTPRRWLRAAERATDVEALDSTFLESTRFGSPEVVTVPGVPDLIRDSDSVVAGYLSMSWSAPHLHGARLHQFVEQAHRILRSAAPDGMFWDWPGDTEIVVARRRAAVARADGPTHGGRPRP